MRKNVLFICTMNLQRSKTAEEIYKKDDRFLVKSAGTDKEAMNKINRDLLNWADFIIVMERFHRNKIREKFPEVYEKKRIICLYIKDEYDYMQEELIRLIKFNYEKVYLEEDLK